MSAKQSPPSATAIATSSSTLPESWAARADRHGANAADNDLSTPREHDRLAQQQSVYAVDLDLR